MSSAARLTMPKRRADPRQKFADSEWLVDIVIGAEIECGDLLGLAVARRKHDDRAPSTKRAPRG